MPQPQVLEAVGSSVNTDLRGWRKEGCLLVSSLGFPHGHPCSEMVFYALTL